MKKILYIISLILLIIPFKVKALPSGEIYSESATRKYELGRFYWEAGMMSLYGHNGTGDSIYDPQIQKFRKGIYSLYTYEVYDRPTRSANYTLGFNFNYSFEPTHTYEAYVTFLMETSEFNYYFSPLTSLHEADILNMDASCSYDQYCSIYVKFKPRKSINVFNLNYTNSAGHSGLDARTFDDIVYELKYPQIVDLGIQDNSINDKADEIKENNDFNKNQIIQNNEKNKNEIIENQDKNTNSINENIGALGSSINSNIDSMKDKQDQTNQELGDLNNNITNSDVDSSGATGFFGDYEDKDYGLYDIITAPLEFIKTLTNQTCNTMALDLPFVSGTITLPCMSEIYTKWFGKLFILYQTITTGFIAYWVGVRILFLVKGFKDPENDKIEVMDL